MIPDELSDNENEQGHPTYLSDNDLNNAMGAIIKSCVKKNMLPFIKSNFGKLSEREMARRLGIGKTAVNRWCMELGLEMNKNTVNDSFFKTWTAEMAYILGYIFADGNINWKPEKSYRSLTITAVEKDREHLENLRTKLESTKELLYAESTKSYRMIANSRTMCMDLMKKGLTPKKSLTLKFPGVPKKFLRHFIRGIIDGDGNVRYVKRKRSPYFEITISSGSEAFLKEMATRISSTGIDAKVRKAKQNTYILQYSCRRGLNLARWIYKNENLHLDRKFRQYEMALKANCKGGGEL